MLFAKIGVDTTSQNLGTMSNRESQLYTNCDDLFLQFFQILLRVTVLLLPPHLLCIEFLRLHFHDSLFGALHSNFNDADWIEKTRNALPVFNYNAIIQDRNSKNKL